jgi:hypothetical protein
MVTKVSGSFTEFGGKVRPDERNPGASSAQIVIKVRRIDTQNAELDAHLRSNDFFSMDEFPEITFTSLESWSRRHADHRWAGRHGRRSTDGRLGRPHEIASAAPSSRQTRGAS